MPKEPKPKSRLLRVREKPFTAILLLLLVGGSVCGFIFTPEIRSALAGFWIGSLVFGISIADLAENGFLEDA